MKKTITKEFKFEAAHLLHNPFLSEEENVNLFGKCNQLHGHSYKVFITLSGQEDDGMILNYNIVKDIYNKTIYEAFDHKFLNQLPYFENSLTTAENIVHIIFYLLKEEFDKLKNGNVVLEEVKLYETETSCCTFKNENS